MQTKLSKIKAAAAAGDWPGALRIAAKFADLGDHRAAITRAHEAHANARFYRGLGQDPEALIAAGIAALKDRYNLNPNHGDKTMDTNLTAIEIAKITAAIRGEAGYKRAASKAAAIKRLSAALADKGLEDRLPAILSAANLAEAKDEVLYDPSEEIDTGSDETDADFEQPEALIDQDALPQSRGELLGAVAGILQGNPAAAGIAAAKADDADRKRIADKPQADGPRPGTRARGIFDMMTRPGGATAAEMKEAGLGDVSISIYAGPMAEKFGFTVEITPEGRTKRYALIKQKAA